ncbi:MAG: PaaX family transcriptional regulator C-terminal domain-containing protein [Pseudomonadota bacterium]
MDPAPQPVEQRTTESIEVDRRVGEIIEAAHGEPFRVWSVVITIFGDIVAPRGGAIPMSVLQRIAQSVHIEPGALRTAVSRLVKDNVWLMREKEGRNSIYRIAREERAVFAAAEKRIYASGPQVSNGQWLTAFLSPTAPDTAVDALRDTGFLDAGNGLYLWSLTQPAPIVSIPPEATLTHGTLRLSDEARDRLAPRELNEEFEILIARYRPLMTAIEAGGRPSQREALAARVLLIHHWRRLVLRHPDLPRDLHPPGWKGEPARDLVGRLYRRLLPYSEAWLARSGFDWGERMGETEAALKRRF